MIYRYNRALDHTLLTKYYILTQGNDEKMTSLHLACKLGSLDLVKFIIEQSTELHILEYAIDAEDHLGLTPIYHLCQRGFLKKAKKGEVQKEHEDRKHMIELLIQGNAEWCFVCKEIGYTPLHWLAYWNDFASINHLLKVVDKQTDDKSKILRLMFMSKKGLTPIDIAG